MKFKTLLVLVAMVLLSLPIRAQEFGIKTNHLFDAFMNVNLRIEASLAPKWTLDTEAELNDWTLSHDRRWKHWAIQPEARYWLCDRFAGHFFGVHVHGGQYNIGGFDIWYHMLGIDARKLKDTRYEGWFTGLGIACGYASFEGSYKHNEELSRSRVNALKSYVQKLHSFSASDFTTLKEPENGAGLKKYVEDSNLRT